VTARALAFVDTETTSLFPDREAWEIAIVRREVDGEERAWEGFLSIDLDRADPQSLAIGGYYRRHPAGMQTVAGFSAPRYHQSMDPAIVPHPEAAAQVAALTHGATIVGACPWFDTHTLERLLRGRGYQPAWHYRLRDVEALAAGHTGNLDLGGLTTCARAVGVEVDTELEHTAMGDVLTTMRVWDAIRSAS